MFARSKALVLIMTIPWIARADETLYRYEGDVILHDASTGWIIANSCEFPCGESVENGRFVLRYPVGNDFANFHLWMDGTSAPVPTNPFWVEWRFHSNHPLGPNFFTCDASFRVAHESILEQFEMYGDAVITFSGDDALLNLDINEFHTFRFETLDGARYRLAVDGIVFVETLGTATFAGFGFLQLLGFGGCDGFLNTINEWDYVRYGTIAYGEQIVNSDPPTGTLNNIVYPNLDRFTVTFDSPNYVFVDEISVSVTGGVVPTVTQTRRLDNGEPETVEIVLDRAISLGETTTFTFNDGTAVNVIEYTLFAGTPSDSDGDGVDDLLDNCPNHANPNQEDCDDDGTGDVCTIAECVPGSTTCADCDDNSVPDGCQPDSDGDSVIDPCDPCPNEAGNEGDADGDTIPDCNDQCPGQDDLLDSDGNNIPDCLEDIIIPTLSPWGLLILSAALFIASRRYFQRQIE